MLFGEAGCVLVFVSGDKAGQVAVGLGLKGFRTGAIVTQASGGKDAQAVSGLQAISALGTGIYLRTILDFKFVERGKGDAESTVKVAKGFKDLGFELVVGTRAL